MGTMFPTYVKVNDEGSPAPELLRCDICKEVVGYHEWGGDLRTEGYLDTEMIETCWNFTFTLCPKCYEKELKYRKKGSSILWGGPALSAADEEELEEE